MFFRRVFDLNRAHPAIFGLLFQFIFPFQVHAAHQLNLPMPEIETLSNGLKVVWFVRDSLPMIDLSLFVKAGHRDDSEGKSGTLALLSAALDRGSAGLSALSMARKVESLGAIHYVIPDEDSTSVGLHGLAPDAPELLDLLGKYVLQPDFPIKEVKREHSRLLDRWSHIEDSSEILAQITYQRVLSADTSYARGSFASVLEFNHVNRDDIIQYYKKFFTPKNSLLVVVGRVDRNEFKKKVLSVFGQWQGDEPQHQWRNYRDRRLKLKGEKIVLVDRPDLNQAQIRLGFRAPLVRSPEHHALVVGNALLGDYFNSRLNALIRDQLGLTYSIQSAFGFKKDYSEWTISSSTRNETVGPLIAKTLEVLKTLKKGSVTAEEVETAKTYLQGGFPLTTATLNSVASRWLSMHLFGLNDNYLTEFMDHIEQVKMKDVQAALSRNLDPDHIMIVVAGDAKKIIQSLREAKLGAIKKISISDLR